MENHDRPREDPRKPARRMRAAGQQGLGSDPALKGRAHESQQKMQQERMPEQGGSGSSMEHNKSVDKMMGDEKGKAKERK